MSVEKLAQSIKGLVKVAAQSRAHKVKRVERGDAPLIVMGNGPSLLNTMAEGMETLKRSDTLAVNFAANTPQFREIRPRYYVLADPVFFRDTEHPNVKKLWENMAGCVDWPMTLFVPVSTKIPVRLPENVNVQTYNFVGVEGYGWLTRRLYGCGLGMPRPRNVLIPSIMIGIWLGYKEIYVVGADHTWSKTLEVDANNTVISVQPHFYEDNKAEAARVASVYADVKLHEIMYSFHVAFKAYHQIEDFARKMGVNIYNATPGSFIDAFRRRDISMIQ